MIFCKIIFFLKIVLLNKNLIIKLFYRFFRMRAKQLTFLRCHKIHIMKIFFYKNFYFFFLLKKWILAKFKNLLTESTYITIYQWTSYKINWIINRIIIFYLSLCFLNLKYLIYLFEFIIIIIRMENFFITMVIYYFFL